MIPPPENPDDVGSADAGGKSYFLKVVEDPTNKTIRLIKDPLNLISVMGPARSGKSTLMNLLAGCKGTELFATYPGMETFTKGVYVPTRVLSLPQFSTLEGGQPVEAVNPNLKVSFVDTEGQGAVGAAYYLNLFSPALLTSRVVIYNRTGGLLTDEILSQLGMMTRAAQRLRVAGEITQDSSSSNRPTFGHLFILFNQFRLNAVDKPETLKVKLLTPEKEVNGAASNRNQIRALLASVFESIQVFILPDKLKEEARDALSDGTKKFLLLDDFQPVYHEYFSVLRSKLSEALKTPRELSPQQPLTGGAVADFMPLFADAINRAEPLNIPSIFEASQNEAIARAKLAFTTALSKVTEAYSAEQEPKPTQMLARLFDNEVALVVAQLAVTLSYMPNDIVARTQDECTALSGPFKDALLAANLARLRVVMSSALRVAVAELSASAESQLQAEIPPSAPPTHLLVPVAKVELIIKSLQDSLGNALRTKAEALDPEALPDGWDTTLREAAEVKKTDLLVRANQAWAAWVINASTEGLDALTAAVVEVGKQVKLGDTDQYKAAVQMELEKVKRAFVGRLEADYQGQDKDGVVKSTGAQFADQATAIVKMQEGVREQNKATVKKQLMRLEDVLELEYKEQLRRSIEPDMEPVEFGVATSEKGVMDRLFQFCQTNNVSEEISAEVELELRSFISDQKSSFRASYTKAKDEFRRFLEEKPEHKTPTLLLNFQSDLDRIDLTLPKTVVESQCLTKSAEILVQFDTLKSQWQIQPDGVVSRDILETARRNLSDTLSAEVKAKLDKYDEVVSAFNKALLSTIVVPLVDRATSNKYAHETELENECKARELEYFANCHGDKDGDARVKWENFKNTTYLALVETVKWFNAFKVPGLSETEAINKKIQLEFFTGKAQDMGLRKPGGMPGNEENDRASRMVNTNIDNPASPGMYDVHRSTNLEWFDWTVEISDIMWGKPIITDIKPLKVNSTQYSPQPEKFQVQVGNVDATASTITDSINWGLNSSGKVSYKWGETKTVGEHAFEASFGLSFNMAKTTSQQKTYTTDTRATLVLPANRTNVIYQMVFDQRTTLPYTARVRVIPRLRFQNGYTAWGSDPPSFRVNPRTGALKDNIMNGRDRVYEDFDFKRVNGILEGAREDADPWMWQLAMERRPDLRAALECLADPKTTEVYVKGKWEGITGKYAVNTVAPLVTNLTLLPTDI